MIVYLVTWLEEGQGQGLTNAGCDHRLLSYNFLRDPKVPKDFLEVYAREGVYQYVGKLKYAGRVPKKETK